MKRSFSFLILLVFFLSLQFCGKKGPIWPPEIRTPQKIEDLNVFQRGDKAILEWTNPTAYEDGKSLPEVEKIEVWLYEEEKRAAEEGSPVGIEEFTRKAKVITVINQELFPWYRKWREKELPELCYVYKLSNSDLNSKKFTFGLRIKYKKRREAPFSDLRSIEPRILPLPPQRVLYALSEDRIVITWNSPDRNINQTWPPIVLGYNIYRMEEGEEGGEEELPQRVNPSCQNKVKFEDLNFIYGKAYRYFVRASATPEPPFFESDDSEVIEVLPRDIFPPAHPTSTMSVAGENVITISWDENREEDLAGYRIWRKEEDEDEYILLTPEPIRESSYNDTTVEKNIRYYYAITALDVHGNESRKSDPISEVIKDEW